MGVPVEQRLKFFVYVIESPSDKDFYHSRREGVILRQAVELNGIHCAVRTAITPTAFRAALEVGLQEEMGRRPGEIPIVHISAHGDRNGIQLSNGTELPWRELKETFRPINKALGGALIVCMSSCEGFAGIKMAMHPDEQDYPYFALIGCFSAPTWSETAVAYTTFYHQLHRGEVVHDAVKAMCIASLNQTFVFELSADTRKGYIDHLKTVDAKKAQHDLEQLSVADTSQPSADAKALHASPVPA